MTAANEMTAWPDRELESIGAAQDRLVPQAGGE